VGTSDARWGCADRNAVQLCELRSAGANGSSLRAIRNIVNEALAAQSPEFDKLYAKSGRPSIPPEKLLRALLLQAFYSVRSERQLMEQLDYNLLFRWFVGCRWMPRCGT
jgi:transposase